MSNKRHYTEKEIAAIFEQATRAQEASRHANPHEKGLTLEELQAIGAASGITPDLIAQAATALDHAPRVAPPVRTLGMKVGVGRTIDLPGKLTDEAWQHLLLDIRETFQARGNVQHEGSLRQWTNGNLQVLVESTSKGDRLRMKTINRNLQSFFTMGSIGGIIMLALTAAFLVKGDMEGVMMMSASLLMFLAMLGYSGFKLPGWAGTREKQMEALGARAVELVSTSASTSTATDSAVSEQPVASAQTAEPALAAPLLDLDAAPDSPTESTPSTRNRVQG